MKYQIYLELGAQLDHKYQHLQENNRLLLEEFYRKSQERLKKNIANNKVRLNILIFK